MATRLNVERDGTVELENGTEELVGRHDLIASTDFLSVWRREPQALLSSGASAPTGPRILMAGEVVTRLSILEALNVAANTQWCGELVVRDGLDYERVLGVNMGAITHARTEAPHERLGQLLEHEGVLQKGQSDALRDADQDGARIGQLCVLQGLLTESQLFEHLNRQVETIFHNALVVTDGVFVFRTLGQQEALPAHQVHLPIQALLMEGVQRIDEMALFRESIPSDDLRVVANPEGQCASALEKLDESTLAIYRNCDGQKDLHTLAVSSGLGRFAVTKAVYQLLKSGCVHLLAPVHVDPAQVTRLLAHAAELFHEMFSACASVGRLEESRQTIIGWLTHSSHAALLDGAIDADGMFSAAAVQEAIEREGLTDIAVLEQALHETATFALFSCSIVLPRDDHERLTFTVGPRIRRQWLTPD